LGDQGLSIVDISKASMPKEIVCLDQGKVTSVFVQNNLIFMNYGRKLCIFDIADIAHSLPQSKKVFDLPDKVTDLFLARYNNEDYLYIAAEDAGLYMLQLK